MPELSATQLSTAATKESFYALCEDLGLPYPHSHVFSGAQALGADSPEEYIRGVIERVEGDAELSYPLIVKADDGGSWANVSFPGRRKVFLASEMGRASGRERR